MVLSKFCLCLFLRGYIPDYLDGAHAPALPVIEGGCPDHEGDLPSSEVGEGDLSFKYLSVYHPDVVRAVRQSIGVKDVIDQGRARFSIERNCIGIIALAEHIHFQDAGHLLHCTVPGYDVTALVDDEGCIREEIDYISKSAFILLELALDLYKVIEACTEFLLDGCEFFIRRLQIFVFL